MRKEWMEVGSEMTRRYVVERWWPVAQVWWGILWFDEYDEAVEMLRKHRASEADVRYRLVAITRTVEEVPESADD